MSGGAGERGGRLRSGETRLDEFGLGGGKGFLGIEQFDQVDLAGSVGELRKPERFAGFGDGGLFERLHPCIGGGQIGRSIVDAGRSLGNDIV